MTPINSEREVRLGIHAVIPRSEANGPGVRFTIWVQGCSRACDGCFNPKTLPFLKKDGPRFVPPATPGWIEVRELVRLIDEVHQRSKLDGISVSGGEPFDQPEGLMALLRSGRGLGLSVVVFTGYMLDDLTADVETAGFFEPEPLIDILVDGPYDRAQPVEGELRGSANQRILLLTDRYNERDLVSRGTMEVSILPDGTISVTGFSRAPFQD